MNFNKLLRLFITYHTSITHYLIVPDYRKAAVTRPRRSRWRWFCYPIREKLPELILIASTVEQIKLKFVQGELGADVVIDYLKEDFVGVVKKETNGKGSQCNL